MPGSTGGRGRRGRAVRIAVAAAALVDAGATHDAEPGGHAEHAAAGEDRLGAGLAVDVDHGAPGGPAVGDHEVAVGSMSIARGSLSGAPVASTDFAPVAGFTRTTWWSSAT